MKNKPLPLPALSIVLMVTLFGVNGCHKPGDGPGAATQFSATINGEAFQPIAVASQAQNGLFVITGFMPKATDTIQLQLSFRDTVNVNSKLTFKNNESVLHYINTKGSPTYSSWAWYAHGDVTFITVDKINKKLAGNFSGVIYLHGAPADSLVVKDGRFNTSYK